MRVDGFGGAKPFHGNVQEEEQENGRTGVLGIAQDSRSVFRTRFLSALPVPAPILSPPCRLSVPLYLPKIEHIRPANARLIVLDWLSCAIPLAPPFNNPPFADSCVRSSHLARFAPPRVVLDETRDHFERNATSKRCSRGQSNINQNRVSELS